MAAVSASQPLLIDRVVTRLSEDFHTDASTVRLQADEIVRRRYSDARVQSFIPILVERELRELLRASAPELT